jgi:hypothetical protein
MNNYHAPDHWVIIQMNDEDPHYRVLSGWYGILDTKNGY